MNRLRAALLGAGLGLLATAPVPSPAAAADVVTSVATVPGVHDISPDHHGTVYVTDPARHRILAVRDGAATVFADQIADPAGLAVDGHDNVYVGTGYGRILRFTPDGARTIFAVGKGAVLAVAIDPAGNVYWAETNTVRKATPDGHAARFAQAPRPAALAADGAGTVYVATATQVLAITAAGTRAPIATGRTQALAVDAGGTLYASDGCAVRRLPAGPPPAVCAGALAVADGVLYYADARTGQIGRVGPAAAPEPSAAPTPGTTRVAAAPVPPSGDGPGAGVAAALLAGVALLAAAGGTFAHHRRTG
ncbi:hypothetical protein ACQP1P_18290 [Dactylosporangium sp. CA-052675]|uniref:hypothetical protein n=1 Tax=Dactylosporangium sp. CA-052675 TaxID=3239927 RepID=UPI003D8C09B4